MSTATAPALELNIAVDIAVDIVAELKSAFAKYQTVEKHGLAFGQRLYELRAQSFAQGHHHNTGFTGLLRQAGIPRRTAYFWINRYESSIGEDVTIPRPERFSYKGLLLEVLDGVTPERLVEIKSIIKYEGAL